MSNYISLYNETNGEFNNLVVDDLEVTNLVVENIDVKNATVQNATIQNATIINENVTNAIITDEKVIDSKIDNLVVNNNILLNSTNVSGSPPTLNFFDIDLGIFRSNPNVLSIISDGYQIVDIDSLSLKVNGLIEAVNANISGTLSIGNLNTNNLNVSGTSSFADTITCKSINAGTNSLTCGNLLCSEIADDFKTIYTSGITIKTPIDPILSYSNNNPIINTNNFTYGNKYFSSTNIWLTRIGLLTSLFIGQPVIVNVWDSLNTVVFQSVITITDYTTGSYTYIRVPRIFFGVGQSFTVGFFTVSIFTGSTAATFDTNYFSNVIAVQSTTNPPNIVFPNSILLNPGTIGNSIMIQVENNNVPCTINSNGLINSTFINNANTFINTGSATIGSLTTTTSNMVNINCTNATISNLTCVSSTTTNATTTNLLCTSATTTNLLCTSATTTNIICTSSTTTNLLCTNATTTNLICTSSTTTSLNCTNATVSNLTSTTITNSGTLSSGNTTINGTLQTSQAARFSVGSPNTNSTNAVDVYGLLGMSIANSNTFYGINAYYSGGFRPIRNGYSAVYRLDGGGGGISILQTTTTNTADSLITNMNAMIYIFTNGNTQFFGSVIAPSCYLSTQPMLVRSCTTSQTITNNLDTTFTQWNTQVLTQGSGIIYSGGIYTLSNAGTYFFCYEIRWDSNATGVRESYIVHTSRNYAGVCNQATSRRMLMSGSCTIKCAANDTVALNVYQNSGGNLTIQPSGLDGVNFTVLRLH